MMNIQNLGSKESLKVKFKGRICAESCLKLWFESECYFCYIYWVTMVLKGTARNKVSNNHFLNSVWKCNCPEVHCTSNQMMKYQLPHTRFKQISDHKHDINTCMECYLQNYWRIQLIKYQKQPFADVLQIRCSWKIRNVHWKKPVLETLFDKVAGQKA